MTEFFKIYLLQLLAIFERIKVSSCASFHKVLHSFSIFLLALAIILNQCFVSFDSFLQIQILFLKSFF